MRKKLIHRDNFLSYWQFKLTGTDQLSEPLRQLREEMPAVFAGTRLDHYTGYGYRWRTLQNEKSRREVPAGVFVAGAER